MRAKKGSGREEKSDLPHGELRVAEDRPQQRHDAPHGLCGANLLCAGSQLPHMHQPLHDDAGGAVALDSLEEREALVNLQATRVARLALVLHHEPDGAAAEPRSLVLTWRRPLLGRLAKEGNPGDAEGRARRSGWLHDSCQALATVLI